MVVALKCDPYQKLPSYTIDIDRTIGQYSGFSMDHNEEVFTNIHQISIASNFPSIDSYILTEKSIIMFQSTLRQIHPVNSSELLKFLQSMQLLNSVRANTMAAQLIFVVPKGLGENFRSQDIEGLEIWSGNELNNAACTKFPGIGDKTKKLLLALNIKTIADLLEAYHCKNKDVEFVKSKVRKWIDDMEKRVDNEFLRNIPQYVIEFDFSIDSCLNSMEKE